MFAGGPNLGPKGKRPFIVDDGVTVADSTLIRFHLEQKYGLDFDAHLTPQQKGVTWAVEKMCEEHLYFAVVYFRWIVDKNFNKGPATFFNKVPALVRPLIRAFMRNKTRKMLYAQGLGRHTEAEIAQLACRDVDALAQVLGEDDWFGGTSPCAAHPLVRQMQVRPRLLWRVCVSTLTRRCSRGPSHTRTWWPMRSACKAVSLYRRVRRVTA